MDAIPKTNNRVRRSVIVAGRPQAFSALQPNGGWRSAKLLNQPATHAARAWWVNHL